jgi:AraC-like DNA-binding protein
VPSSRERADLANDDPREGSIRFVRLPTLFGAEVMDVRQLSRKWAYFHETYSFCSASWVADPRDVGWRYRQRTHYMNASGVQLMEPGEFHSNTVAAPVADFRVLLVSSALVQRLHVETTGRARPVHLSRAQLGPGSVRNSLQAIATAIVDAGDGDRAEDLLYDFMQTLSLHGCFETACPPMFRERGRKGVRVARDLIHAAWNQRLPLSAISEAAQLPVPTLERAFREAFGTSPRQYQIHLRMMRGKELLRARDVSIVEAAQECGFRDPKYFSRLFKREFHCRPSEYRA